MLHLSDDAARLLRLSAFYEGVTVSELVERLARDHAETIIGGGGE